MLQDLVELGTIDHLDDRELSIIIDYLDDKKICQLFFRVKGQDH
jgi:hypothetical protein